MTSTQPVYLLSCRVQREQIIAKQQEEETARLKNSGRTPKGSKDGLRPESPHGRRTRRPPVRKMIQAGKTRFEVCYVILHFFYYRGSDCLKLRPNNVMVSDSDSYTGVRLQPILI